MSIPFNDNIDHRHNKLDDRRKGPWSSVAAALAGIPVWQRVVGLPVRVVEDGVIVNYIFKDGVADENLKLDVFPISKAADTDDTDIGNDKILVYKTGSGKHVYEAKPGRNIDGGNAASVYLPSQIISGGNA